MALNAKKRLFIAEYLVDLNAGAAAKRAGYGKTQRSSEVYGSRLLLDDYEVAKAVAEAIEARAARTRITADRVLKELARIAFADLRSLVTWGPNGITIRDSDGLTDDDAATASEVTETTTGKQTTVKVKQIDKLPALRLIMQHLGMLDRATKGDEDDPDAGEMIAKDTDPETDDRGEA